MPYPRVSYVVVNKWPLASSALETIINSSLSLDNDRDKDCFSLLNGNGADRIRLAPSALTRQASALFHEVRCPDRLVIEKRTDPERELTAPGSASFILDLLHFDGCASFFKLSLNLGGFVFACAFLDRLRCAFNQRLGFAQAQ